MDGLHLTTSCVNFILLTIGCQPLTMEDDDWFFSDWAETAPRDLHDRFRDLFLSRGGELIRQ